MIVFVAGSKHLTDSSDPDADGIYRTVDGGENWELVLQTAYYDNGAVKGGKFFCFDPDSYDPGQDRHMAIYAGLQNGAGITRSTDGGASWENLNLNQNLERVYDMKIDPHAQDLTIWVCTAN